jgi:DUF1009 family protein
VEQSLGLICGAGVLPARMAQEARRQGWRVVAFAFGTRDPVAGADRTIASRVAEIGRVVEALREERVSAVLFSGRLSMRDILEARDGDSTFAELTTRAGSLIDMSLFEVALRMLGDLGITVLDQRAFVGDWLPGPGCWSSREPTEGEWRDVRRGLEVGRLLSDARVGQTIVIRQGVVTAVEGVEGTTETIRRGAALGGPGAVVVKSVAADHDYRLDSPAIGPETIEAAAAGSVAVVAVQAHRVFILERDETVRRADAAGVALVSAEGAPGSGAARPA